MDLFHRYLGKLVGVGYHADWLTLVALVNKIWLSGRGTALYVYITMAAILNSHGNTDQSSATRRHCIDIIVDNESFLKILALELLTFLHFSLLISKKILAGYVILKINIM